MGFRREQLCSLLQHDPNACRRRNIRRLEWPNKLAPAIKHNLYALDAKTGQKIWNFTYQTPSLMHIVLNGIIYISGDYVTTRSIDFTEPATFYAIKPATFYDIDASTTQQNTVSNDLLMPALIIAVFVAFLGVVLVIERRNKKLT